MSNSRKLAVGLALLGACVAAGIIACESVPLTAAPGTSMQLIANPTFVIANGGVSVVTAILVEPAGTFVPDGTEVFFFTNLGRVDASGKTRNGVARVNFVSDARSGTARVTAISGGPSTGPAPTPSPSPAAKAGTPSIDAAGDSGAADQNSAFTEITVGALPEKVLVTADPQRITSPRQSAITANVFDGKGNPLQNVPVIFSLEATTTTTTLQETLDSGGAPQFTDSNGQAFDTLRTKAPVGVSKTVKVIATPAAGKDGFVIVTIN